ncbi:ATP-dependent helicase [Bacteroides sp. 519]|uniref:ATP-dependent helicase n=1 Tax=Bacteroides sp. 519 TaxID=2302937 RepID=UPI0013D38B48|nr:UvrD-helicase domain-containing protein [Bacteroides sp. 519]NDV58607.1 ATP-dependent DNA helicase [Bacteroides sp. 519]
MSINYLEELNESQQAAVMYNEGPSLVIAGAGSGKTRVLTYKIAYLLDNGYNPWNILALTFTNKAAREMKERIAKNVGGNRAKYLWMGTFHSIFSRILRVEASLLGFTSQFTIYDTADTKSLLRSIMKEMKLDEKMYKPGVVQTRISNAKNLLISPAAYAVNRELIQHDMDLRMPAIRDIYSKYWERCKNAGAMDFDDLLFYTFILFRDFPDVLQKYSAQFRYVLVDEYQDTNYAQHSIVYQLTKENQKVCVVGDDAQSIYSFRGANIDNILNFTKIYPTARIFKLEQNYRSTQTIVSAANSLIEKNQRQIPKEVFSEKERGEPIGVFQAYSDMEEGEIVVNKISEIHRRREDSYSDFAILYRTNAQSRIFEEALRRRSIPYKIYGGLSFYQRKEIKDAIAYFRLVVNANDEEAFKRIINYPARGIGDTTVGKIIDGAVNHGVSLWTAMSDPLAYEINISKATQNKIEAFRNLITGFMVDLPVKNAYDLGRDIIYKSGIMNDIRQDNTPENLSRQENIEELMNGVQDFCSQRLEEGDPHVLLIDFLSEVALLTDQDSDKGEDEKVTLMTIHAAKGLEFPNVFVVGMEENLFPGNNVTYVPSALEEERRLFYVAITRAEKNCFLSFARNRMRYGKSEFASPSRFLRDIDTCYLELPDEMREVRREQPVFRSGTTPRSPINRNLPNTTGTMKRVTPSLLSAGSSGTASNTNIQVGQNIEHERFGIGEVLKIEGDGDNMKATIHFKNAGNKQLLLRFARFKVLND